MGNTPETQNYEHGKQIITITKGSDGKPIMQETFVLDVSGGKGEPSSVNAGAAHCQIERRGQVAFSPQHAGGELILSWPEGHGGAKAGVSVQLTADSVTVWNGGKAIAKQKASGPAIKEVGEALRDFGVSCTSENKDVTPPFIEGGEMTIIVKNARGGVVKSQGGVVK